MGSAHVHCLFHSRSIVLTVVGIGCSRWMLDLMNTPDDVVNYALIYMRVYFLGTIGNLIYNMGSGILRAVGDSKRPLLYLIICCMYQYRA